MSEFSFPKQTKAQQTGRVGETFFEQFVVKTLKWIFRPVHHESDFGLDGFIDIVTNEAVTGRGLAVQIKCGDSYIAKTSSGGIKYLGSIRHLNYYLNNSVPIVLIVLSSNCQEGYWVEFDILRTIRTGTEWWIEIPQNNHLDNTVLSKWAKIAGTVEDFSEEIQTLWAIDEIASQVSICSFVIPNEEVVQCSMCYLNEFLIRQSKTMELMIANRGKYEISFSGYDSDQRELYEIPEIRKWFDSSIAEGIPWFYFLNAHGRGDSLKLLLFCTCEVEVGDKVGTQISLRISEEERRNWLNSNFDNLNVFTKKYDIPLEINKERSEAIFDFFKNSWEN